MSKTNNLYWPRTYTQSKKENYEKKENNYDNVKGNYTKKWNNYDKRPIANKTIFDSTNNNQTQNQKITKNDYQEKKTISDINAIIKAKHIICPECGQHALINIKDYKITLHNCKYSHKTENILLSEFMDSQNKGLSNIKCDNCLINNKNNTDKNEFFRCLKCQMNLCPQCKNIHDKRHKIVNYELIYYICTQHNYSYINYCDKCKKNLCNSCNILHKGHEIKPFQSLYAGKNYIKSELEEMKSKVDQFIIIKNEIQKILDDTSFYMISLYNINSNIFNNCHKDYLNYEVLSNLNTIDENYKMSDIDNLINEKDIIKQFALICDINKKMTIKEEVKTQNLFYSKLNMRHEKIYDKNSIKRKKVFNSRPKTSLLSSTYENIRTKKDNNKYLSTNNSVIKNYNKTINKDINKKIKSNDILSENKYNYFRIKTRNVNKNMSNNNIHLYSFPNYSTFTYDNRYKFNKEDDEKNNLSNSINKFN